MSVNRQKNQPTGPTPGAKKQRGTQDELEIIALICLENQYLRDRVLQHLEEVRGRVERDKKKAGAAK